MQTACILMTNICPINILSVIIPCYTKEFSLSEILTSQEMLFYYKRFPFGSSDLLSSDDNFINSELIGNEIVI